MIIQRDAISGRRAPQLFVPDAQIESGIAITVHTDVTINTWMQQQQQLAAAVAAVAAAAVSAAAVAAA